jgi:hypothetical protein
MATTNNKCKNCGCDDSFMPSPAPCPTPAGCPTPQPCSEVFDAQCVIYNGADIICNEQIVLAQGTTVAQALTDLITYIQTLTNTKCDPLTCVNAYDYLTEYSLENAGPIVKRGGGIAAKAIFEATAVSPAEVFDLALDTGIIIPIDENSVCCPKCGPYVLASVETFLKFADAWCIIDGLACAVSCCINVYAGTITYEEYIDEMGQEYTCQNGFAQETLALTSLFTTPAEQQRLLDKGIVEHGSLNEDLTSNISNLKTMIQAFFASEYNESSLSEILDRILDKGLVVYCTADNVIIGSVETFLSYSDNVGIIPRPCCTPPA